MFIQSVIFEKKKWTVEKAKKWLKLHKFKYGDIDEKEKIIRFRQIDPSKFKKFKTHKIKDKNITLVFGF